MMSTKKTTLASFFCLFSLTFAISVQAATLTVKQDLTGNYSNIQDAIDNATAGDEVVIYPGTYQGDKNRDLTLRGKAITVRGLNVGNPSEVVIDCQGSAGNYHRGFIFNKQEGALSTVKGLTIINGFQSSLGGGIYCFNNSSPTISNCVIKNNQSIEGNHWGGGICLWRSCSPTIQNCLIVGNQAAKGAGIFCDNNSSPVITNCTFSGNSALNGGLGGAIYVLNTSSPSITNCILWGDDATYGSEIALDSATAAITVAYSDVQGYQGGIFLASDVPTSAVTWGLVNINTDPMFADAATGDYHLTALSSCIDRCDPASVLTGQVDIDGEPRVINGLVDMGADEIAYGTVAVDTGPVKGTVLIDNVSTGTAPLSVNLPIGTHTVDFGPVTDYDSPATQTVTVVKNTTQNVTGTYVQHTGLLVIATNPFNAEVFVNGASWGTAPVTQTVPVGTYKITFAPAAGYITPLPQTVVVQQSKDGSAVYATGSYTAAPNGTGTLAVDTVPVKGEVYVDGTLWGVAPQSNLVAVGSHTITFGSVDGYTSPAQQTASVDKDQTTSITGKYALTASGSGTLAVDTTPVKGDVYMDGVFLGTAPINRQVAVGSYTISFSSILGYNKPGDQTIIVSKDQTTNVLGSYIRPAPAQVNLTTTVTGQGTVSPDNGSYDINTLLTLKATAMPGWKFDHWEGDVLGTTNPTSLTMYADKSIKAVFVPGTETTTSDNQTEPIDNAPATTAPLCALPGMLTMTLLFGGLLLLTNRR